MIDRRMGSALLLLFCFGCDTAGGGASASATTKATTSSGAKTPSTSAAKSTAPPPPAVSSPATSTAPPATSASSAAAGACKLDGDWTGKTPPGPTPVNDKDMKLHFGSDGKGLWETPVSTQEGDWTLDDKGVFILKNTGNAKVEKSRFQCPTGVEGKYNVTWSGCDSVTFKLDTDGCEGRAKVMNGIVITRKK